MLLDAMKWGGTIKGAILADFTVSRSGPGEVAHPPGRARNRAYVIYSPPLTHTVSPVM